MAQFVDECSDGFLSCTEKGGDPSGQGKNKKYRMESSFAPSCGAPSAALQSPNNSLKVSPLEVFWLKTTKFGNLAMSSLPGRTQQKEFVGADERSPSRSTFTWRSHLDNLIGSIGITDIFLFCTAYELERYLPGIDVVAEVSARGAVLHHFPIENGRAPSVEDCAIMHESLQNCLKNGRTVLMSSKLGYGRAPTVLAAYLLSQAKGLSPDQAMQMVREARGNAAVQTVKQYNFLHDYFIYLYSESFQEMQAKTSQGNKRTMPLLP